MTSTSTSSSSQLTPGAVVTTGEETCLVKRGPINLKSAAFSKLVSNSSSLDEGVESDLSSPISSTFSFASTYVHPLARHQITCPYPIHNTNQHNANATMDTSSSLSSCLTSFESHCCPSPVSTFMKTSVDESLASNNSYIQHSTSCASASPNAAMGHGKKHSLPASLALNRKYKFSALKRNFFK